MNSYKRLFSILITFVFLIVCSWVTVFAAGDTAASDSDALFYVRGDGVSSDNQHIPRPTSNYGSVISSHLIVENGDYVRVERRSGKVIAETYSPSFALKSTSKVDIELERFGGFCSGKDAYYLAFGQKNEEESNDVEVFRIVKYDKNWKRIGACSIKGANTVTPFDAGSLAMCEYDGILYVHTCHTMYQSSDGLHHQANCTFKIQESDMTVLSSYSGVMNLASGYVSHSFDQKIAADENMVYRADLGDGYPRGIALTATSHSASVTRPSFYGSLIDIPGDIGQNYTGFALGGLELSDDYAIVVGYGITEDSNATNIFVSATNKNSWETTNTWITDTQFGTHTVLQKPKLVKLSSNKFLLTWEETNTAYSCYETKMVLLGADGSIESDIKSLPISLSECEPITDNSGRVVWYYTEGSKPMFVRIDPDRLDEAVAAANDSKDINLCSVEVGYDENTYTGEELKPSVSVSRQGKDLQEGTDYEVAYSNNIEPGTGIVTVTGKGEYTGVIEKGFSIQKAYPNFDYEISQTDIEIGGTAKIDAWGFENAQFTFNSVNKDIASVSEDGTVQGLAEGEAQIEITALETEHYRSATSYIIVNVSKDVHSMEDVSVTYANDNNNIATVKRKCKVCGHEETVSFTTIDNFSLWYWQTPNTGHGYPDYRQTEGRSISITVDYTEPDDAEDTTLVLESSNPDIMAVNGKSVRFVGTGKVTLKIYAKYRPSVYDTVDFLVVHAYDEGKVTKQATCLEKGQKVYTCSVCGDKYTEELAIDPSNHTGGTYLKGESQETCGEDGYTGDECCSGCNQVITKGKVIPATGNHSFDEGIVTAEPTCKDPGYRTYTCSVCGNSYDEEIPADTSKHEWNSDYTVDDPASCTVDGSESIRCRVCGEAKDTRPIPATGHHFGEWYVVEANTCENDGLEQRDCDYCGLSETRGLDATGHDWEEEKRVDLEPTCEMDGSMSIHCRRCDAVLEGESEVIPALGHDWEEEPSVEIKATCTQDGLKGIHCLRCGVIQEGTDVPIPKTGHKFSTWKTTKAATELAAGQRTRTCSVCGRVEKQTIAIKKPSLPAPTIKAPKAAKKSATVKWKKLSKANQKKIGYIQIQYSTDKKFRTGVKTVTAKKSAASKKITKLTSKKIYYVRIRSYKKSGSTVHISKWSTVKSVKAK